MAIEQTQPATSQKESLKVVQRMYDCFNKGDMATLKREVFAPDLVWHLPGRHPLSGTKRGADEVIAFFGQLNKAGIIVDLILLDQLSDGSVVEVHRGHTPDGKNVNGATLDARNCTNYHIENGKIKHVQVYISDQHAVDNFFWAAFSLKPIPDRLTS